MLDYADCLAGLVHALGLVRPHILGHSFGSGLALELYRRHPELPRSLVLAGSYAGWAGSLPPDEVERRLTLALRMAELPPDQLAPQSVPGAHLGSHASREGRGQRSTLDVASALHAAIPGSKLVVLPGLGHESYLESAERFNREVRNFLRSVT